MVSTVWDCLARRIPSYGLVERDTPSFAAITLVAPGVRFSVFEIFVTPAFDLAIVFICLMSSLLQARRTIFFALAIYSPSGFVARVAFITMLATNKLFNVTVGILE